MHAHEKRLLFAIGVFVTLKRLKIYKIGTYIINDHYLGQKHQWQWH